MEDNLFSVWQKLSMECKVLHDAPFARQLDGPVYKWNEEEIIVAGDKPKKREEDCIINES
jgi:hypothetical protein